MRSLGKENIPQVLNENHVNWLAEWLEDKTNSTKKFRYRNPEIKTTLKAETGYKCIYCESKIGHNTPGDIEHIIPSSKDETKHFIWDNLTIACTECNRRKNAYYEEGEEFLNPYTDKPIEELIEHYGPIVNWKNGQPRAEMSIKILELNKDTRSELISQKIQKIEDLNNLIERYQTEANPILKKIHEYNLRSMSEVRSEYSGMVKTILEQKGII